MVVRLHRIVGLCRVGLLEQVGRLCGWGGEADVEVLHGRADDRVAERELQAKLRLEVVVAGQDVGLVVKMWRSSPSFRPQIDDVIIWDRGLTLVVALIVLGALAFGWIVCGGWIWIVCGRWAADLETLP